MTGMGLSRAIIVDECVQGTNEWKTLRCGIPTASNFDRILSPVKLTKSAQWKTYAFELVEARMGYDRMDAETEWMRRGIDLEAEAAEAYAFVRDAECQSVGLVYSENRLCCGSPDRLVGDDGGLEIKCPKPSTHFQYLYEQSIPPKYLSQVYGYLWLTGREWWDWVSYLPEQPMCVLRVGKDDEKFQKWVEKFEPLLAQFCKFVDEATPDMRADL